MNEAKKRLRDVEEGLETLNVKYLETTAKKEELAEKCALCSARLERAEKYVHTLHLITCTCLHKIYTDLKWLHLHVGTCIAYTDQL